eukprot:1142153-Pelagomonas_calceolata.AAC.9
MGRSKSCDARNLATPGSLEERVFTKGDVTNPGNSLFSKPGDVTSQCVQCQVVLAVPFFCLRLSLHSPSKCPELSET